jgi:ubiquitin-conjugating enzyme E2 Q
MFDDEGLDEDYPMDVDDFDDFDEPSPAPISNPSVPLKGRKRFLADLEEMRKNCVIGFSFQGFDLRSTFNCSQYHSEWRAMFVCWVSFRLPCKLT